MKKYIFLDKEGTITLKGTRTVGSTILPTYADILIPLKLLTKAGYHIIIISNEPEIAEKRYTEKELNLSMSFLMDQLQLAGVLIDDYFYCPHLPEDQCLCRKPLPGLFIQASEVYSIDFANSWMIGDELTDVVAGKLAGCNTILLDRCHTALDKIEIYLPECAPDFIVQSFEEITAIINNNGTTQLL